MFFHVKRDGHFLIEISVFSRKFSFNRYAFILAFPLFLPMFTTFCSSLEVPPHVGLRLSFIGSSLLLLLLNRQNEEFFKKLFYRIPKWVYIPPLLLEQKIRTTFFLWVFTVGFTLSFLLLQCFVESNSLDEYFAFRGMILIPLLALRSALSLLSKSPHIGGECKDEELVEVRRIFEEIEKGSSLSTVSGVLLFWFLTVELFRQGENVKKRGSLAVEEIEKVLHIIKERGRGFTEGEGGEILEKTSLILLKSKRSEFLLYGSHPFTLAGKFLWGLAKNPSSPWAGLFELEEISEEAHQLLKQYQPQTPKGVPPVLETNLSRKGRF
jgi:hypothetical protein